MSLIKNIIIVCILISNLSWAQNNSSIKLDPAKVQIFEKYLSFRHSFEPGGFIQWKANNPELYSKEMWYQSESFYIKRNHLASGLTMNEGMIDVCRFEYLRKEKEEVIVTFPGFKDVMVLLPKNKLIYVTP